MTGKKWYRLGMWLLAIGVALMIVGLIVGYRYLTDQSLPVFLDAPLEDARTGGRLAGALVLCGPGLIFGLIGYSLIEKFSHNQWD